MLTVINKRKRKTKKESQSQQETKKLITQFLSSNKNLIPLEVKYVTEESMENISEHFSIPIIKLAEGKLFNVINNKEMPFKVAKIKERTFLILFEEKDRKRFFKLEKNP